MIKKRGSVLNRLQAARQRSRALICTLCLKLSIPCRAICGDQSTTPTAYVSELKNIVRSISELTMKRFIECYCTGNVKVLADHKEAYTDADIYALNSLWGVLLSEYYAATGDEKMGQYVKLQAKILRLKFQQDYCNALLYVLDLYYNERTAELLREEFSMFQFTQESYKEETQYARNYMIRYAVDIEFAENELKALSGADGKAKALTPEQKRANFIEMLLAISQFEGYSVGDNITVEVFAVHKKRYEEHIDRLQKEAQKMKGNGR